MSELRQDPLTGEWVIVAPERNRRPGDWRVSRRPGPIPSYSPDCPFCPGKEDRLLGINREWKAGGDSDWSVRAVPNRYPAIGGIEKGLGHAGAASGDGVHEVLIEGAAHDRDLADFSIPELSLVISAYQQRFRELADLPRVSAVALFRNRGPEAGASLVHPHSQILALTSKPPRLAAWEARSRAAYEQDRACPTCVSLEAELRSGIRVVAEDEAFVTLVPFAALGPFEQLIVPKVHMPSFADMSPLELQGFAGALKRALLRLRNLLDDPPCNFVFESGLGDAEQAPFMHWQLRLVPRLTIAGGFERLTGMAINPSLPEDDASLLRTV